MTKEKKGPCTDTFSWNLSLPAVEFKSPDKRLEYPSSPTRHAEGKRSVCRSLCTTLACLVGLSNEKLTIIQNVGSNTTKGLFLKYIYI